ncbi:methyltransferase domain-containing protein, partial [Verrucomicrobium spinosum]|uniref:methyltransferase domain-containing protein n=1 Tax=Verrucomicrobium spinosum TaxID=2736 RepID=UPI000AA24A2C
VRAARATDYPDRKYGLICFFDCLHDMGDPVAAAQYAAKVLAPDGTVLLVEPFANDRTEDNISPVARLYYTGSTMLCCPHAVSEGGHIWCWRQGGRRGGRGHEPHALHDVVREAQEIRRVSCRPLTSGTLSKHTRVLECARLDAAFAAPFKFLEPYRASRARKRDGTHD